MDKDHIDKLMASLTARDEALRSRDSIIEQQQSSMTKLLEKIEDLTKVQRPQQPDLHNRPPAPGKTAEDIRKDKYLSLYQNLQKCSDIKAYKHSLGINVREWLKMVDSQIGILSTAVDLKLTDIKDAEYVNLIRSKLDFVVLQEMELKFAAIKPNPYLWTTISTEQLSKLLIEQFGQKEPDLAALLKCFGANRYKKTTNVDVRNHYCRWWEQIPLCLKQTDEASREKFVDLVHRTLF